jgi:hypothetical protein
MGNVQALMLCWGLYSNEWAVGVFGYSMLLVFCGAEACENTQILKRRCVAGDLNASGNLFQEAAHDFSTASFW